MTILITGGAGYIGSHMVHEFADAGEPVVVLDNLSNGFRFLIPTSVPFVSGSTGDRTLVSDVIARHGVTAIIHFAASIVVPESVAEPLNYYGNNTMNTCALLDAAIKAGVRQFIFSSTAAVYGAAEESPVREDSPTIPISPYGTSKLMSEIMLHDAAKAYGLRFVILRYFNVAGADPRMRTGQATPAATHLIKVACETAIGKRPKLEVFGTDYPRRTAHVSATTSTSAIWRRLTPRRLPIYATAARARRSIAVTDAALQCLKLSTRCGGQADATFRLRFRRGAPVIRPRWWQM
jgi:UDP-glucose 4-epimerase